jgi:hypothetical protein
MLIACDFSDDKLVVKNNSKDSIAFIIPAEPNYFPTSHDNNDPRKNNKINVSLLNTFAKYRAENDGFGGVHFLAGYSSKHIHTFNIKWEHIIDETPDRKLKIMFVPADIMTSGHYKWKDIYEQNMFKEMTFTKSDLDKTNWTVEWKKYH